MRVEAGKVQVEDAHGQPPTIPFWLGRRRNSRELSAAVARLRGQLDELLGATPGGSATHLAWLTDTLGLNRASASRSWITWPARAWRSARCRPDTLIMERFFDESGDAS